MANSAHNLLTHKQLETHGCIPSIVAADALVPMHQGISTHSADNTHSVAPVSYKNIISQWTTY